MKYALWGAYVGGTTTFSPLTFFLDTTQLPHLFPEASVTENLKLGGLKQKKLFSHCSGGQETEMKYSQGPTRSGGLC